MNELHLTTAMFGNDDVEAIEQIRRFNKQMFERHIIMTMQTGGKVETQMQRSEICGPKRERLNFEVKVELLSLMKPPSCSQATPRLFITNRIPGPLELAELEVKAEA
jgi:hypothetical protein